MAARNFRIKIGSTTWTVHRTKRPRWVSKSADKLFGEVDYGHKRIYINPDAGGHDLLNTVIHEFVHARLPEWEEQDVITFADQLTRFIERIDHSTRMS